MTSKMNSSYKFRSLFFFLLLCFAVEIAGGWLTQTSVNDWYQTLNKPSFNPPNWVFGPVWTVLYVLIAVSGWLVYCTPDSSSRRRGLVIYGVQLCLNVLWSFCFFFLKNPWLGFLDILALLGVIAGMIVLFWPVSRAASVLLWPYLIWTCYAMLLNASIVILNIY